MMRKKKLDPLKRLKKKADQIFSKWIRNRDKRCYTCGSFLNLQAGHYHSRSYWALRFDERNVHAQCVACNVFKHGNMPTYSIKLVEQYGQGIMYQLETEKRRHVQVRKLCNEVIQKYGN